MITGLDHVQVAAPRGCEDEARRFYGGLLGLAELDKPSLLASRGGVWFSVGRQALHVGVTDDFVPATKAHPALRLESPAALERLATRLADAELEIVRADPSETPGVRRLYVSDPWGNRVELLA